jgi:rhodanese-related sulfurtransferase
MKRLHAWFIPLFLFTSSVWAQSSPQLDPSDFQKQLNEKDVQLLDVRTAKEFEGGHIPHAFWADWNNQSEFLYRVQYLDKSRPVYVYCLSGGRSAAAAKWMRSNGYGSVYELKGGITAWRTASMPTEGVTSAPRLSMDDFKAKISSKELVLVDFGAEWCPPCKKMEPVLAQLKKERGQSLEIMPVDAGTQSELMKDLQISALPGFILYKHGKETWRKQGLVSISDFNAAIDAH